MLLPSCQALVSIRLDLGAFHAVFRPRFIEIKEAGPRESPWPASIALNRSAQINMNSWSLSR